MNPTKVIRAKCLECSNGSSEEVRLCPVEACPLWRWRFGKNPDRKPRELSAAQRDVLNRLNSLRIPDGRDEKTDAQ